MAYADDNPLAMDTNVVPMRNIYPGAMGGTLGTLGSASSPDTMAYGPGTSVSGPVSDGPAPAVAAPSADSSVGGHPLTWWLGIAIVVAAIFVTARKSGNAEEFSNLRASTYNIAMITFIAILGITVMKIIAVKVKDVPGLGGFASVVIAS